MKSLGRSAGRLKSIIKKSFKCSVLNFLKKTYHFKKIFFTWILTTFIFLLNINLKADWTKVTQSSNGQSFYVDMETIIESKGFVYFGN